MSFSKYKLVDFSDVYNCPEVEKVPLKQEIQGIL